MEAAEKTFEGWAILELMGHRRLAGWVEEVQLAGHGMIRLDVPEHPWQNGCTCGSAAPDSTNHELHAPHCQMFRVPDEEKPADVYATQFYSPAALYCLTPTTEPVARSIRSRPAPVHAFELPALLTRTHDEMVDALEEDLDERDREADEAEFEPEDLPL